MKMRWKKCCPERSGFYMAWNPIEEDYPHILHCQVNPGGYDHWTYPMHRVVVEETFSYLHDHLLRGFFKEIKSKSTAKDRSIIDRMESALSDYQDKILDKDDAYTLNQFIDETCNDLSTCVYDVARPDYWAEVPYLPEIDTDAGDQLYTGGSPTQLDIEVEDIKSATINKIADEVSLVLSRRMSDFSSPWEAEKAPWAKGQ